MDHIQQLVSVLAKLAQAGVLRWVAADEPGFIAGIAGDEYLLLDVVDGESNPIAIGDQAQAVWIRYGGVSYLVLNGTEEWEVLRHLLASAPASRDAWYALKRNAFERNSARLAGLLPT